jgi:hypothetical protein
VSRRTLLLCLALAAALRLLVLQGPPRLPAGDFVEYWAAGRLNLQGANPYDPEQVAEMERQAGRTGDFLLMWNPPWTLSLVMPLGLMSHEAARLVWLLVGFLALGGSADVLWRLYGGPRQLRWLAWLLTLVFLPSCMALIMGQITPFVLLGAVGFLWHLRRGEDLLAGAATVFLAIKPHLAYLFWIALAVWVLYHRRWRVLAGAVLAALALCVVPLVCNPAVLEQFRYTFLHRPPSEYRSPTLGTVLRLWLGEERFGLQMLGMVPGLVWLLIHGLRHRRDWRWQEQTPLLLLVSVVTAAYGAWLFDLVVLLVAVLQVAARLAREGRPRLLAVAALGYLLVNAAGLLQLMHEVEYFAYLWMAPTLLLFHAALRPSFRGDKAPALSPTR